MKWNVIVTKKVEKSVRQLPERLLMVLQVLINDLETKGPAPGKHWQNYGKLRMKGQKDKRHCHLVKGNPTYVCCWQVDKVKQYIEVYYVGTHEKAPY